MKYPISPDNVNPNVTKPSKQFVADTYKVSLSIVGFVLIYLILFIVAVALALAAGYLGFIMVVNYPRIYTIMLGIALCAFGLFIIFFLLKFISTKNVHDTSHLKEVTAKDEPQLFEFISKVVDEVGSNFPKKVFLSNEVNAYVFYNSNFWSLFFPVKKNLTIGLGLINSINLSEFKAILAHEFGHFSQKSMKLGSYIYYVNRVIHDMLYNNDGYEQSVQRFSETNGYLALAGSLTFLVVRSIQFVLKLVYKPINAMYMALSRQMEFHADSIAASVTGGNHLISSLQRLEMSDLCFNTMMSKYQSWEDIRPENLYQNHKEVQKHYAEDHDLEFKNGVIGIGNSFRNHQGSRVQIKDQWASHPSTEQRAAHLNSLELTTEAMDESPWILFKNSEATQRKFTQEMFRTPKEDQTVTINNQQFSQRYYEEFNELIYPKEYNGFFDSYFPMDIELKEKTIKFEEVKQLLSKAHVSSLVDKGSIYNDLHLVHAIKEGQVDVKTFDFDGEKYKKKKATEVYDLISKDAEKLTQEYAEAATIIFNYYYQEANNKGLGEDYKTRYQSLGEEVKSTESNYELIDSVRKTIAPIFEGNVSIPAAKDMNDKIKSIEKEIKQRIQDGIQKGFLKQAEFDLYLSKERNYFSVDTFNEANLEILFSSLGKYEEQLSLADIKRKREFLQYQINL